MGDDWIKRQKTANQIIEMPRAKSDPPRPPMNPQSTEADIDAWGEKLKVWQEENKHLPNLQPVDTVIKNFKNRLNQMNQDQRMTVMEQKLDKLMNHLGVK
jgi:hypothetical protein